MSAVELVIEARPRDLGDGITVGRVLPQIARRSVGPFLFLDHMGPLEVAGAGVRPHPHLHLATVTYLLEGELLHRDSVGSRQSIAPGAINWMTAGRGIAHSERPPTPGATQHMHGLQLWVGLPRAYEDVAPGFQHVPASAIPTLDDAGAHVRVLAGAALGASSPVATLSPLLYLDVRLDAGAAFAVPDALPERAVYVLDGEVAIGDAVITPRHLAVLGAGAVLRAARPARLVVLAGEPLDGPRYLWWNFVSSSKDRIAGAAADWRAGRFATIPEDDREFVPAPDGPPESWRIGGSNP